MEENHVGNPQESVDALRAGDMSTGKLGPVPPLVPPKTPAANGPTSAVTQVQVKTVPNGKPPPNENGLTIRDGDNIAGLSASTWRLVEIAIAEIIGTACLMFFGCMGSIGENLPPLQGALVFGLTVCTIIQIFGHISAAHLNPSVTVVAIVLGKITPVAGLVYFVAETIGGILGFGLLKLLTPCDLWDVSNKNGTGVCTTTPYQSLTETQSLSLEFLATMFLVLVVCSVWDERNADKPDSIPLKFAATITVISIIVGPFTGASMNPVRTLAPSIFNGVWTQHWVYWIGPMSSAFLTSVFYQLVFDRKQPFKPEVAEEVPLTGVTSSDSKIMRNLRQSNITTDTKQNNESQSK